MLVASDCTIAIATLPALVRREPDARIVWLDAHGDFNTPDTTASGYLGGMCLAAACGRWDAGFGGGVDPARVVLADARDLDAARARGARARRAGAVAAAAVADAVRGERVFLHLDLDVLDPSEMPCSVPRRRAASRRSTELARRAGAARRPAPPAVGVEVTAMRPPAA